MYHIFGVGWYFKIPFVSPRPRNCFYILLLTLDIAHTVRPSRNQEIGAKHYITTMLNEPSTQKRQELFGKAQEERSRLRSMIEYRMKNGCSYRLEFTFRTTSVEPTEMSALVHCLQSYVKNVVTPQLRSISCDIFPKCLWTVYDYFWNISLESMKLFREQGYIALMEYPKREFLALMDRLMVVCLNGNVQRNLNNWTGRSVGVIESIRSNNWPFLKHEHFNSDENSITLWNFEENGKRMLEISGDLFLFRYYTGMQKGLVKSNLINLVSQEANYLNLIDGFISNEQFQEEYLAIFTKSTENFVSELAALVNEKLERHSVSKKASYAFKQIYSSFSQVHGGDYFKKIANGRECGSELFVSNAETILIDDLWDRHVIRGAFSTVQGLPDWFRSWSTLVCLYCSIERTQILNEIEKTELVTHSKEIFRKLFLAQEIMVKYDRSVFWRNVGTFYRIGENTFTSISTSLMNDIGIRRIETNPAVRTRTVRNLPYHTPGFNQRLLHDLQPSRFNIWKSLFDQDKAQIQLTLTRYLGFDFRLSNFSSFSIDSPIFMKWIVLTCFVLAELQVLVGQRGLISNRTSNMQDKKKYRVAIFCVFLRIFEEIPIPNQSASQWKKFYENNKINLRYE